MLVIGTLVDREWDAFLGAVLFAVGGPVLLWQHIHRSESVALRAARAKELAKDDEPELQALVARVAAMADLPPPRVALARSWAPNAFSVGLNERRAVVAVTSELLRRDLTTAELESVVAHELAHVANRDGLVMTFVSGPAMLGSAMWNSSNARGQIAYVLLYWPVHVIGLFLLWTISRYREYVADRGSATITGAPEQLMSALTKISGRAARGDLRGGAAVSALCIVPAQRKTRLDFVRRLEIFMDHPPVEKRLRELSEIARDLGRAPS